MERLGVKDDVLFSIFSKIDHQKDRKSFSQVSKQFLKVACIRLLSLHCSFPDLLFDILPLAPNMLSFYSNKPLLNTHLKLIAQSCPKLRDLSLHGGEFEFEFDLDDDGLCRVANACRDLQVVLLKNKLHVGDAGVVSLVRSSRKLKYLNLEGCVSVTDESLKAIGEATCLEYLGLRGCSITDLGLEYLANGDLKNCLKKLVLAECDKITDKGIFYLKQMVDLDFLDLSRCGVNVTDSGIVAISQIPNIKKLYLSELIKVKGISFIDIARKCLKLGIIDMRGCESVTGEGLRAFAHHQALHELLLFSCNDISWEDVQFVALTCPNLQFLGLSTSLKTRMPADECLLFWDYFDFGDRYCQICWD